MRTRTKTRALTSEPTKGTGTANTLRSIIPARYDHTGMLSITRRLIRSTVTMRVMRVPWMLAGLRKTSGMQAGVCLSLLATVCNNAPKMTVLSALGRSKIANAYTSRRISHCRPGGMSSCSDQADIMPEPGFFVFSRAIHNIWITACLKADLRNLR